MSKEEILNEINAKLSGIMALMVAQMSAPADTSSRKKIEELLAMAGTDVLTIARVTGKNEAAVRKAIHRAGIRLAKGNGNGN